MKTILITLIMFALQSTTHANPELDFASNSAPVYANLEIQNIDINVSAINPFFKNVAAASIILNNKNIILTLNRHMPACPPNMMCTQVMPTPLVINLTITKIENTKCSVKYSASTLSDLNSSTLETLVIEDFTNSSCPVILNKPYLAGEVKYSVTGISSLTKRQDTGTAVFNVQKFIRATN